MPTAADLLASDFATLPDLIAAHARERGDRIALADADGAINYAALDRGVDAVAAALQRDGVPPGRAVAIVAAPGLDYAMVFLGALRAGCVATPLAPSEAAGSGATTSPVMPNTLPEISPLTTPNIEDSGTLK